MSCKDDEGCKGCKADEGCDCESCGQALYELGQEDGFDAGHAQGFADGFADGFSRGFAEGLAFQGKLLPVPHAQPADEA